MSTTSVNRRASAAELVRRHQAGVWRYLRYLGCDEIQADDLTQEAFLAVLQKPFAQRSDAETAAYLRSVARRKLLMAVRKGRRAPTPADLEVAEAVWQETIGDSAGDAYLDALAECLKTLDGRPQQAIDMSYRQGLSRLAIADSLEMTADGVKTLLRRTRNALRRCVEQRLKNG